ncbi:MAG: DUF1232 domain-containing protein [Myxococcota bacterium]
MSGDEPVVIELNPRERRIYDRLRARVIEPDVARSSSLRDLLLLLPDLVVLLFRLLRDERVPLASKGIGLLGVAYILSPVDLLPEILLGPIGLIDDLLIAGAALSRLLNHVHPDIVRSHWSGQGDALDAIQRVTAWTERNFTGRIQSLLRWLGGKRIRGAS